MRARRDDSKSDSDDSDEGEKTCSEPEPEDVEPIEEEAVEVENWIDWIKRATGIAEGILEKCRLEDWIAGQRRRLYRWAGHQARLQDNRWSSLVLAWQPTDGKRSAGHPRRRWVDRLNRFFLKEHGLDRHMWMTIAQCRDTWKTYEDDFVLWNWQINA